MNKAEGERNSIIISNDNAKEPKIVKIRTYS